MSGLLKRGMTTAHARRHFLSVVALLIGIVSVACVSRLTSAGPGRPAIVVPRSEELSADQVERLFREHGVNLVIGRPFHGAKFFLSSGTYSATELADALATCAAGQVRMVNDVVFLSSVPHEGESTELQLSLDLREGVEALLASRVGDTVSPGLWRRTGCPFTLEEICERRTYSVQSLSSHQESWLVSRSGIPRARLRKPNTHIRLRAAVEIQVVAYPDRGESRTSQSFGAVAR